MIDLGFKLRSLWPYIAMILDTLHDYEIKKGKYSLKVWMEKMLCGDKICAFS